MKAALLYTRLSFLPESDFVALAGPSVILGASLFLGFTRESGKFKPLFMAVVLIIMFNWLLHTFWGNELFLFSPHWHFASVVGLIPLVRFLSAGRGTDILIVLLSGPW